MMERAHNLAMETLRTCPAALTEQERFFRVCMAIGCDFPDIPVVEVLAVSEAALSEWKRSC